MRQVSLCSHCQNPWLRGWASAGCSHLGAEQSGCVAEPPCFPSKRPAHVPQQQHGAVLGCSQLGGARLSAGAPAAGARARALGTARSAAASVTVLGGPCPEDAVPRRCPSTKNDAGSLRPRSGGVAHNTQWLLWGWGRKGEAVTTKKTRQAPASPRDCSGLPSSPAAGGEGGSWDWGHRENPHTFLSPPALPPALQQLQGLRQVQSQLPCAK